jgi:hypothetical protein
MLETEVASMASAVQTRTMRGCYTFLSLRRVYEMRDAVVKSSSGCACQLFCLPGLGSFIVIQQMDAPLAQEK